MRLKLQLSGNVLLFKDSKISLDPFINNALFRVNNNHLHSTCQQAQTNELGMLEMQCYCHAELNSRIKFHVSNGSSTTFETIQLHRLNKVRHDYLAQQALPCRTAVAQLRFKRRALAVPN